MSALAQQRLEPSPERGTPPIAATIQAHRLALLPVWVARLEYHSGRLLTLVNGQSGQVAVGSLQGSHSERNAVKRRIST